MLQKQAFQAWKSFVSMRPHTVKPVLNGHLKIDKTKVLMENCSLMEVKSIAECSLQYF